MMRIRNGAWAALALLLLLPPLAEARQAPTMLPSAPPLEVGLAPDRLARLDSVMNAYVSEGRIAGMVTLVARQGQVAQMKGYGTIDIASGQPMPADAIFRIASQTKALVSVAAMILVEEGRLLLSDPVADYIPAFAQSSVAVVEGEGDARRVTEVPARRPMTIRDLLTHTSGLGYGGGPSSEQWRAAGIQGWYFADRAEPIAATVERIATLPLDAHPGERYVYGYSTDVLGVVVERISGMSLDAFIRSRITEPLGMRDTHFYLPPEKASRLAAVHAATESGGVERAPADGSNGQGAYLSGPRQSFSGGAGLLSTANDYARFLQMLLDGGELDGVRVLGPATVALMTRDHLGPVYTAPGAGFGLGFEVTEDPGLAGKMDSPGAFRWGGAYFSTYWVDPEQELVAVFLAQLIPSRGLDLHEKFSNLVYQSIVDPSPTISGAPAAGATAVIPRP
jgi:CubicO group peptidase (beta-lactamase class C family)